MIKEGKEASDIILKRGETREGERGGEREVSDER